MPTLRHVRDLGRYSHRKRNICFKKPGLSCVRTTCVRRDSGTTGSPSDSWNLLYGFLRPRRSSKGLHRSLQPTCRRHETSSPSASSTSFYRKRFSRFVRKSCQGTVGQKMKLQRQPGPRKALIRAEHIIPSQRSANKSRFLFRTSDAWSWHSASPCMQAAVRTSRATSSWRWRGLIYLWISII